jgi:hypothetical protein
MRQIVTSSNWADNLDYDAHQALTTTMEQFSMLIRENAELQAKCEGYEKYVALLEGQIKIAENIILHNSRLDSSK